MGSLFNFIWYVESKFVTEEKIWTYVMMMEGNYCDWSFGKFMTKLNMWNFEFESKNVAWISFWNLQGYSKLNVNKAFDLSSQDKEVSSLTINGSYLDDRLRINISFNRTDCKRNLYKTSKISTLWIQGLLGKSRQCHRSDAQKVFLFLFVNTQKTIKPLQKPPVNWASKQIFWSIVNIVKFYDTKSEAGVKE